jgi:hypothetical protein
MSVGLKPGRSWPTFAVVVALQIWLADAIVFFAHEYAHSTTAWLMGWKANPLALTYGHLTISNLLLQFEIDENVNYAPIFDAGHGWQAGIIAAAGVVIGNGVVTYFLSRWAYALAERRGSRLWAIFFYWALVASVGNFICYVPVRTFSYREDMHTVASGFACSPWWILIVLGIPFCIALVQFFGRLEPLAVRWLLPESAARRNTMVFLTAFAIFGFYGAAGWSTSGVVSHWISVFSVCVLVPVMTLAGLWLTNRMPAAQDASYGAAA